jgi:hypothetical protein
MLILLFRSLRIRIRNDLKSRIFSGHSGSGYWYFSGHFGSYVVPDQDPTLKLSQLNSWQILSVHNGTDARLLSILKNFEENVYGMVCNQRRAGPFWRKICKNCTDFLARNVRFGSGTFIPDPHGFRSVGGLLWGTEPRFELGPALQQADVLLSEPRRTLCNS